VLASPEYTDLQYIVAMRGAAITLVFGGIYQ
jgi:hypothetical protein